MNAYEIARAEATRVVEAAYRKAVAAGELPEGTIPPVAIETPKDSSNGDWASTFAMQCAKPLHMAPRKIAESIVANLDLEGSCFDTVTIAGPGFMNFTLNQGWYEQAVRGVFAMGENYGRTESKKPEKVMVEFVSANPTGPMHMGNARGGVLGDCLSSVLDWSGNDVTREFYINDAGNQVDKFAHSVEGRYIQQNSCEDAIEFDASWYQGDDIKALAHDLVEQYGDSLLEKTPEERFAIIEGYGLPTNIARMERDLARAREEHAAWEERVDADQRLNLNLSFGSASLREVVSAFTEQTGVVFSYETSLGKRTLSDVHVVIQDAPLEEMLNTLFYDTGISWKIKDHVVALTAIPSSKKNASTGSAPSPSANRKPVVTGRVVNEEGEPLVGVNVLVKGTTQGTSTDIDGSYSIAVADDDVLQFTYLGYGSAEWRVGTQTRIDVVLKEDKQMLDEVVVVGYGTGKRRALVGAVEQVDSKVFSERSNPSISRSLQGAIPNLNISMRDGKPSRAATINIRGTGSIGSGGGALVLIDGVEGDLETVNPQDIASVSVLKDASSAAIYGARGAFGVILVTTKSAEEGETKVTYNGCFSLHARTG